MPPRLNIPPVTRVLLITLVAQSLLSATIRYRQWTEDSQVVVPYLNLVPSLSIWYPWTLLTTTFVESNIFTLAIACAALLNGGRYLERAWSSAEFAKFVVVSSLAPNLLSLVSLFILFKLTDSEHWILSPVAGTIPLQISFLIAFSQLVPAHTVTVFRGVISLRVPRFPLIYVGLIFFLTLTPLLSGPALFLAIFGFTSSWTYLRFYKTVFPDMETAQPSSLRGDGSQSFAFAEFFPGPAKPLVAAISGHVFQSLVSLRLCQPLPSVGGRADAHHMPGRSPGGGSKRAEAERRRALALKALDQRLNAATAAIKSQPPAASANGSPASSSHAQHSSPKSAPPQPGTVPGETSYMPDHDKGVKTGE